MIKRSVRLCFLVALSVLPLSATTTNLIGIVAETAVETKTRGERTMTTFVVRLRNIWGYTMQPGVDDTIVQLKIGSQATIFLDGKRSTAEEAFKPGHLVKVMGDVDYYACYSSDFRFDRQLPDSFGPDRGVYRLRLPNGASASYRNTGKPGKNEEIVDQAMKMDLFVHLLCREGSVVAAAASQDAPPYGIRVFSLPIDPDALRIADGRVQGTITVTLLSQGRHLTQHESGTEERSFTIDAPLGRSEAEGTFSSGDTTGTLTVSGSGEPVLAADRAVVIYNSSGTGGNGGPRADGESISLDARFKGDSLDTCYLSTFAKGYPGESSVSSYELQWDDFRFSGTIVLDSPPDSRSPRGTIRIEGVLIGDQLFGSTRSDISSEDLPGRMRGLILRNEAPPIIGWNEGNAKRWLENHLQGDEAMPDIMPGR